MAAGMRGGLGLLSWIFLGGALVMMFFVVLSGVVDVTPLNKIYFLQADTSGINGAKALSQWTYLYVCGANNVDCGAAHPALPFGFAWLGGTGAGAPGEFLGDFNGPTSYYYWYVWRFGWVFYIIGLAFGCFAVFSGLLSFTRIGSGLSGLFALVATFFTTLAAILMTVEFVKARDVFVNNGRAASVGIYAFGFTWAAVVSLFIASMLFFGGCFIGRHKNDHVRAKRGGFFRRNRSVRSRGSFVESESQRRVKDEY